MTHIHWFRQDLRLTDNPSLAHACEQGDVVPVYILDTQTPDDWAMGAASRWWLHHSLTALDADLREKGSRLMVKQGDPKAILDALIQEAGATSLSWNRCYEPAAIARDKAIKADMQEREIDCTTFNAFLMYEPWEIKNGSGEFYKVFTPFWKACLAERTPAKPAAAPRNIATPNNIKSDTIDSLNLLPTRPDWSGKMQEKWQPGERGAHERFENFIEDGLARYADKRDFPADGATSSMSAHLHFGEVSPRALFHRARETEGHYDISQKAITKFNAELGWREFSTYLLYHFPELPDKVFNPKFSDFPWDNSDKGKLHLKAWQQGLTGYPLVDAGMRELWQTGHIHNRVRMVVASFLTKHLLLPWQEGEKWFWDCLIDADLGSNSASWQWVAGCGADAAPYFRVFNPIIQSKKFDGAGEYIKQYVPELRGLDARLIHTPWEIDSANLARAGIELKDLTDLVSPAHAAQTTIAVGASALDGRKTQSKETPFGTITHYYPTPIINHPTARDRALEAYEKVKG